MSYRQNLAEAIRRSKKEQYNTDDRSAAAIENGDHLSSRSRRSGGRGGRGGRGNGSRGEGGGVRGGDRDHGSSSGVVGTGGGSSSSFGSKARAKRVTKNKPLLYSKMNRYDNLGGNGSGGAIYGEITAGSFSCIVENFQIFCELSENSTFGEFGSGLDKPNQHIAAIGEASRSPLVG